MYHVLHIVGTSTEADSSVNCEYPIRFMVTFINIYYFVNYTLFTPHLF